MKKIILLIGIVMILINGCDIPRQDSIYCNECPEICNDQMFKICLQGCMFYDNALPYDNNNSRGVYFDYCVHDCNDEYSFLDVK